MVDYKIRKILLIFFLITLVASFTRAQVEVILVWDKAQLLESKQEETPLITNLKEGMILQSGQQIVVEEGHNVSLLTKEEEQIDLTGPIQYIVKGGEEKTQDKLGLKELYQSPKVKKLTTLRYIVMNRDSNRTPIPILPRGKIRGCKEIVFSWIPYPQPGTKYVLKVWREEKVLLNHITTETSFKTNLPEIVTAKKKLKWGVGRIDSNNQVIGFDGLNDFKYFINVFSLKPKQKKTLAAIESKLKRSIEKNPERLSHWWTLLTLYYQHKLYTEAILTLKKITTRFGERPQKLFPLLCQICVRDLKMTDPQVIQKAFGFDLIQLGLNFLLLSESNKEVVLKVLEQLRFSSKQLDLQPEENREKLKKIFEENEYPY